jgi:phytoene dehydrogenase-like protein
MSETRDIGRYDAIIIGAGLAGLTAANSLVMKGHRVLVLEKQAFPGGCTMNFERSGYRFEASTHVINGCAPGGMTYRQLEKIGAQDVVEFIKLDHFGRMVDEARGTEFDLPWALDAHVEMLAEQFPAEEIGIRSYYDKYGRMAETLLASLGPEMADDPDHRARLGVAVQDYAALKGKKAKAVIEDYVSDPLLIELMLAIPSGFMGTGINSLDAGSAVMCDMVYRVNGGDAYYPRGGSGHLAQKLADLFQERGGELLLNLGATEITFSNGRASGVVARVRAGRFVAAQGRCVICASDLTAFVNRLCPEGSLPSDYVKEVNERVPGISAVILFAGLDLDLRERGITDCEISMTWASEEDSSPFHEIAQKAEYSTLPSANATIYSNIDPSCCPEGKSVVATMALARPEVFESALGPGRQRGGAYRKLKERITAELLEKMARALGIDDLERHVEVLELATPVTIERYTLNRGGAYVGWKYSSSQARAHFSQQSPIENVFLCGHWVEPGGGVSNVISGGNRVAELAGDYLGRSS